MQLAELNIAGHVLPEKIMAQLSIKGRENSSNVLRMFTTTCLIRRQYKTWPLIATGIGKIELVGTYLVSPER